MHILSLFLIVIAGVALLWFGFSFFLGQWEKMRRRQINNIKPKKETSNDPQSCPICSAKLKKGDLVKTMAFPSITGGKDRLMHIKGCAFCINPGGMERHCPVCGASLALDDILVARIFERPNRRAHVHIVGCNKCRRVGKL